MNKKVRLILFCLYLAFLLLMTIAPWSTSQKLGTGGFKFRLDYILHTGAYFVYAFFYIFMLVNRLIDSKLRIIVYHVLLCLAFAFSTELLQYFLPHRAFNMKDFFGNAIGVISAFGLFVLLRKRLRLFLKVRITGLYHNIKAHNSLSKMKVNVFESKSNKPQIHE